MSDNSGEIKKRMSVDPEPIDWIKWASMETFPGSAWKLTDDQTIAATLKGFYPHLVLDHVEPNNLRRIYGGEETFPIVHPLNLIAVPPDKNFKLTEQEVEAWKAIKEAAHKAGDSPSPMSAIPFVKPQFEVPPGFKLAKFLGDHCPKNFRERVIEALHAENTEAYFQAVKTGDTAREKRIKRMMKYWLIWATISGVVSWAFGKLSLKVGSGD